MQSLVFYIKERETGKSKETSYIDLRKINSKKRKIGLNIPSILENLTYLFRRMGLVPKSKENY